MKKYILDFYNINSKEDIHNYLAKNLQLPDYYGKNLDALFEILSEISEPTAFKLDNINSEYLESIKQVFIDAENDNDNIAVF
ncbi:MAG: barstar family protein [Bacteroidales bacterium]|nr:barstar family protein [Bacteroidales bacterium]